MTPSKKTQKEAFQRRVGFKVNAKIPLFSVVGSLTEEGLEMLSTTMEGILSQGVQIIAVDPKDKKSKDFFNKLTRLHSAQVAILDNIATEKKRLLNVSDVSFVFEKGSTLIKDIWKAKSVPLTYLENVVIDYNPVEEAGNGFLYKKGDKWSFYAAFIRAGESYRFPYDWNTIVMGGVR